MGVPAVDYAVVLVELVAQHPGQFTAAEAARMLHMPPASCFRLVQTLTAKRWIARDRRGGLRLSAALVPIAQALRNHAWLASVAQEPLRDLTERSGLSAKLVVREGADQVTLARVETDQPYAVSAPIGARYPVVLGASGAALLAAVSDPEIDDLVRKAPPEAWVVEQPEHLRGMIRQVRQQGSCQNLGMHPQGIETVAAPVALPQQSFVAAITLIGLRGDLPRIGLEHAHDLTRQAAADCGSAMSV